MESTANFTKNLRHAASLLDPESDLQLISDIETVFSKKRYVIRGTAVRNKTYPSKEAN